MCVCVCAFCVHFMVYLSCRQFETAEDQCLLAFWGVGAILLGSTIIFSALLKHNLMLAELVGSLLLDSTVPPFP